MPYLVELLLVDLLLKVICAFAKVPDRQRPAGDIFKQHVLYTHW